MHDWDEIVRQHGELVWKIAYRLLGRESDASDCFQEAFMGLLAISRREKITNCGGLLRRLTTRRAIDMLLHRSRHTHADSNDVSLESNVETPDQNAEDAEITQLLRKAIGQLPQDQAYVIVMRYFLGMNYREIASQLDMTTNVVGVRLHRAHAALRQRIGSRFVLNENYDE